MRAAFDTALDSDSGFEQCLTQVSDAYPAILFDGIEERPANVDRTGMLQSLTVIEMICAHFPPPESPEK
jgi:hypothetical protein